MINKYAFILIIILSASLSCFGQTTIDFEIANNGYTASATEGPGLQPHVDVFNRNSPNIGGNSTFMWSVEDLTLTNPSIDINQIDVSGSSDFTFAIDMIAHHFQDWDDSDELLITYSIDGGSYQNLMWIQNAGGSFNEAASLDTDFDGNGDCGTGILPALTIGNSGCNVISNTFTTFTTAAIPLSSNTTLDIKLQFNGLTSTDEGIYLDNIIITETSSCSPPTNPSGSISGITPACNTTTLSYSAPNANIYWQTTNSGTSTANPTTSTYNATSSGTYYVRTYDGISCWSINSVSYAVVVDTTSPLITTQPIDQSVLVPSTATFTVVSTNANSYQWQVNTGSGFSNIGGATSNSYTTPATNSGMDGYQYRCVLTNVCGSTNSNAATLNILTFANVVITEIMYNTPGTDDEWIEICNVSGSTQDISNYLINIGASPVFTFPASTTIADGNCITVSLGSNGDGTYNNDCPFTPDFGIPAGTANNNNLVNSTNTITLFASDGTTTIDVVTYDDGDDIATDGGGSSYQIIAILDPNSTTGSNWQAVNNGGSPGTNSLISTCVDPDINVQGNIGTFPNIAGDGTNVPAGFNNTLFDARPIGDSQIKSFRVQNLDAGDLNITSVVITGAGFSASAVATPIASSGVTTFNITFAPLTTGPLTATVEIFSDDPDESPYTFNIKGEGLCATSTITVTNFAPTSGPVGTEVTITGSGFSGASTVSINGVSANVISSLATELVIEIPSINYSGSIKVTEGICYTKSSLDFTLLKNNGSCGLTDLIMTEFYDKTSGPLAYIEIYNGTGSTIDLTNYYIRRYGDATNFTDDIYTDYYFTPSISTINDGQVLFGKITAVVDFGVTPDFYFADVAFAGINGEDIFHLYNGTTIIDVYIEPQVPPGYTAKRNVNTAGPNATSNPSDWTSSDTESLSDLGIFNYVSPIGSPTVNTPNDVTGCNTSAVFDATGTAGGGGSLTYQWYFNEGTSTSSNWSLVTIGDFPLATVSGITGPVLTLSGAFYSYSGYQFYCLVIEDGACGNDSYAAQIKTNNMTWNGSGGTDWFTASNWTPSVVPDSFDCVVVPDVTNDPIIDGVSDANAGSISVLNGGYLLVLPGGTITVVDEVTVAAGGSFELDGLEQNSAQLIQVNDVNNTGSITLIRETNVRSQDYVYWCSPVEDYALTNIANSFTFFWNPTIGGNPGEHGNWVSTTENMIEGKGYAVRGPNGPGNDSSTAAWQTITFTGVANNGNVSRTIRRGNFTGSNIPSGGGGAPITNEDDNWNLIGNPYSSALDSRAFLTANTNIQGTVYLWTHGTRLQQGAGNPFYGDYVYNYNVSDYLEYNLSGTPTQGAFDGLIGSTQGFYVLMLDASATPSTVIFDNSMRSSTNRNDQFFRTSNRPPDGSDLERHRIWLDLVTPSGNTNSTLIAYAEGATNQKDRLYDASIISSSGKNLYSMIDDKGYIIQGRALPYDVNDQVPLGAIIDETGQYAIAIQGIDGLFETTNQDIFIEDLALGVIHNIKNSPYFFNATETGDFNDRFVLRFVDNSLSINETIFNTDDLNIIELNNGHVKFIVGDNKRIKFVTIIDILGRVLYHLEGNNNVEIYNLSNLSQSTYVAKVELFNGLIVTKKAIKRK